MTIKHLAQYFERIETQTHRTENVHLSPTACHSHYFYKKSRHLHHITPSKPVVHSMGYEYVTSGPTPQGYGRNWPKSVKLRFGKTRSQFINYSLSVLIFLCLCSWGCNKPSVSVPEIEDLYHYSIGKGSPIIVIHGGPGLGSAYLENYLKGLSQNHQVIFYDQRNSGRSPITTDTSKIRLAAFVDDIESLRTYYKLDKIAVVGHSWGGLLAINYAFTYPQNISHLILMNSNAASSEVNNQINTKLANRFSADDIEAMTRIRRTQAFISQNPMAYEELMQIGFSYQFSNRNLITKLSLELPEDFGKKSTLLGHLFIDLTTYNFTEQVRKIKAPTLLLYGIDDPATPFAINTIGQEIPNAVIQTIDDAGHFPFIEKNSETLTAILNFVK